MSEVALIGHPPPGGNHARLPPLSELDKLDSIFVTKPSTGLGGLAPDGASLAQNSHVGYFKQPLPALSLDPHQRRAGGARPESPLPSPFSFGNPPTYSRKYFCSVAVARGYKLIPDLFNFDVDRRSNQPPLGNIRSIR